MSPNDPKDPSLSPEDAAVSGSESLPDAAPAEGTATGPDTPSAEGGDVPAAAPLPDVPPPNVPFTAPDASGDHIREDMVQEEKMVQEDRVESASSSQPRRAVGRGAIHADPADLADLEDPAPPVEPGPDAGPTGVCADGAAGQRDNSGSATPVWNMGWDGKPIAMPSEENAEGDAPAGEEAKDRAESGTTEENKAAKPKKSAKPPRSGPFDGRSLGPVLHSEYLTVDPQTGVLAPQPRTMASRIYAVLAFVPLLPLLLIAVAQVAFSFDTRSLWCADETLLASLYEGVSSGPFRFGVYADGSPLADVSPLYFWFLQGLHSIPGLSALPGFSGPYVPLFLGSAVSGLLLLLGGYALARYAARLDRRGALAAGILLLGSTGVSLALHAVQEHLFFAALVTFSHVLLYHALVRERAWFLMVAAFLLAGSAAMLGGAPGLILPLASCLFFLIWTGRVTRFFRLDFLFGLLTGVALPAAWVYLVMRESSQSFDGPLIRAHADAVQGLWIGLPALSSSWFHAPLALLAAWLPWMLLVLFLPWGRLFARKTREAVGQSRTPGLCGIAYMWCVILSGLIVLSLLGAKAPVYVVCLLPALAALSGRAVLMLSPRATRLFQLLLAVLLFILAALFLLLPILPFEIPFLPAVPGHLYFAGGVALLCALLLAFLVKPKRPEGLLLVMALFTAAVAYPLWVISIPTLDSRMAATAHAGEPVSGQTPAAPSPGENSDGEAVQEAVQPSTAAEQDGAGSDAVPGVGPDAGTGTENSVEPGEEPSGNAPETAPGSAPGSAPGEAVAAPPAEEASPDKNAAPESGASVSAPPADGADVAAPLVPAPSGTESADNADVRDAGSPEGVEEGSAPAAHADTSAPVATPDAGPSEPAGSSAPEHDENADGTTQTGAAPASP